MADRDWRLKQLETQPYLRGVRFQRMRYRAYRPDWEHDHYVGCWAKFAEFDSDKEKIEHEGYATTSEYEKGAEYEWVCLKCFEDFRDVMNWVDTTPSNKQ